MTASAIRRSVAVAAVVFLLGCPRTNTPPPVTREITAVSPTSGTVGSTVTLTGTGFGDEVGDSTLTVGGTAVTATAWSDTSVSFTVPDLFPGARPVALTVSGEALDANFEVVLPRRLYSCDDGTPNTVSAYEIAADGQPTPLAGSPFATGADGSGYGGMSNCIRIHAASRRLYAVNSDSVSVFSIDPVTGVLTLLPGSPSDPAPGRTSTFYSLEISPDGNQVFLPDSSNSEMITASVAPDGTLTEVAGSPVATTGGASVAELRANGSFLYLQPEDQYVDLFSVAAGGALTLVGPYDYAFRDSGWTIRINRAGTKVALGRSGLAVMSLDPTTGVPTLAADAPLGSFSVGAIAWHPSGNYLYAADWDTGQIYGFSIAADGTGTPLAGSPWASASDGPSNGGLEVSADGAFLYLGFDDATGIATYALDTNGIPSRVGSGFAANDAGLSFLLSTF